MNDVVEARTMLEGWKGNAYAFGQDVLVEVGPLTRTFGENALLVASGHPWAHEPLRVVTKSLEENDVSYSLVLNPRPNSPREDLYRIALQTAVHRPNSIVALGGGSTIDACKAASVLATYSSNEVGRVLGIDTYDAGTIDPYFGTGMVTKMKDGVQRDITPIVAVQTAASSAAHLTKYSNITDPLVNQKKLIVDDTIVPKAAVFDYGVTVHAPEALTVDGGLDGIAHSWEVFMGSTGKANYRQIRRIAVTSIRLIVGHLKRARDVPHDIEARTALGLGTDLGGYAIMLGGTSGGHLGSFSLIDVLTHGRACGILNPYYTVFFAPNIQDQLRVIGEIFYEAGFVKEDLSLLSGRGLGVAVAKGMIDFTESLGAPTTLTEAGVAGEHLERMLEAAQDPQLKMKLLNMPVPMDPDKGDVEKHMRGILEAALTGNLDLIVS